MVKEKMRIGYFGDGEWAHESFLRIVDDSTIHICFVCIRYDNPDEKLRKLALDKGIDVLCHENINSEEFLSILRDYHADLFVSMSFNQIFKQRTYELPVLKSINCHAGKLPFYRGRNILNWVLINDEKEFGITVHYIDSGIDTGDIIIQKSFPITDDDTYATLLKRSYPNCAILLYDAIKQIQNGSVQRYEQKAIDPVGMYCGIREAGDEIINWNQSSRAVFNFVRALTKPGPGAVSSLEGKPIVIYQTRMIKDARSYINTPGQIIGKTSDGFYVKTLDTFIEVTGFEYDGKIWVGKRMR